MVGKMFSAAMLGSIPAVVLAQQTYTEFGLTAPSEIRPSSSSAKQFGKLVAVSDNIVAVSSNDLVMDYDSSGMVGVRGRVSVFGSDYLRRYKDSGVDFTSSAVNDGYGSSLALWQGTMLIGAPTDSSSGENVGAAYIYYGSNFGSKQKLTAEHGEAGDYFGYSVAVVHGQSYYGAGMAVVGAYGHDHDKESTVGQGCVFVYAMDSYNYWNMVGKLEPQDFEHKDHGGFGYSLSAYGNTVAVGTYSTDKAFVFELLGHLHECPHGHEEEEKDDFPSECLDDDQRRQLRSLQGPPEDNKKWYTEWKFDHILTVGIEEEHKHEKEKEANSYSFGHAVALYNESGLLTLAVGSPDGVDEVYDTNVGLVYVMSIMNRSDVQDNWYPEGYDHHEEDKQREEAQKEAEREEREAEEKERKENEEAERQEREQNDKKRSLQGEGDKNRFRTWNLLRNSYAGDKMGNFWVLEAVLGGGNTNERFGHSLDISDSTLLVGNNPSTFQVGAASYFKRSYSTGDVDQDSPLKSGPLYRSEWAYVSSLQDSLGMEGDHFGCSVSFDGNIAVVGAIMPDIQSDGTFGQGVAYIYDRITLLTSTPTPAPTPKGDTLLNEMTNTHSAIGVSFLTSISIIMCAVLLTGFYAVYRSAGGESSPRQLLGLSDSKPAPKQVRVATMDDSGFSDSTRSGGFQQGLKSAYTGLDTSSAHGVNRNPLPPRPSSSSQRGPSSNSGGGASRTFTPQAKRTFTPKARPDGNDGL